MIDHNKVLKSKQVLKRILKDHAAPYKGRIFTAMFFMVIVAVCTVSTVKLVKPLIDQVFLTHDRHMLKLLSILMLVIAVIKGSAEYFQNYLVKYVGQKILTDLQMQMYKHLLKADFLFIQSQSSGRLISGFTNDIMLMRGALSDLLVGCAKHFLSVTLLIGLMFYEAPYLAIFIFIVFPLAIYPIQKLGRKMRAVTTSAQHELGDFTSRLDETFSSIKVIKSFCTENIEGNRAKKITSNILDLYKKAAKFDALTSPVMEILSGFAVAGLLWYGGYAVIEGKMTAGGVFSFMTAFVSAYRPFKSLASLNVNLQEGITAANRIFNILDFKSTIFDSPDAKEPIFASPNIEFKNIGMKFPNGKEALQDINLLIEAGKTYAFVGSSGSGKTTLTNIITRMFDPTEGKIIIDDYDIKDITLKSLRSQISLVSQETVLFNDTIFANIAYGAPNASRDMVIKAAKSADAHEFILALPRGYDTIAGSNAATLSGGQRQRLSIARAFLKDAPILVLDEATSALDPNSEHSIMDSLAKLRIGRTTMIITHRLSSIKDVDQIVVMKHGRIVEIGTHSELLEIEKEYYKLYNRQLKKNITSQVISI